MSPHYAHFKQFLKEASKYELLTPEKESDLAKKTAEGDKKARELLINSNLRLVVATARRYAGGGLSMPDLVQEGNIGLINAVDRYDWRRGIRFATHAKWWIRQAMREALLQQRRLIRIPLSAEAKLNSLAEDGNEDNELLIASRKVLSLDKKDHEGRTLSDIVYDSDENGPEAYALEQAMSAGVGKLLEELSGRKRFIIENRYGFVHGPRVLREFEKDLGITGERVRQLEKDALEELKRLSKDLEELL